MAAVTLRSRLKNFATEIRHFPRMFRLVRDAAGRWTLLWALLLAVQGLLPAAGIYLTKIVVDRLAVALDSGAGWSGAGPLVLPVALMGLVAVAALLARTAAGWVQEVQTGLLQDHISRLIHDKSAAVQMSFYDFPEFHDHLHRAQAEAGYRPARLLDALGALFQSAVGLIGIAAVLVPEGGWLLPALLVLVAVPSLCAVVQSSLRRQDWQRRVTVLERRAWYYDVMLTARRSAAEMRAHHLSPPFSGAYQAIRRRLRREQLNLVRQEGIRKLGALLVGLAVAGIAAVWVVSEALYGRITVGALAMFYAAFVQGQAAMRGALESAGQLFANSLFLGHLFAFLALETETRTASTAVTERPLRPLRLTRGIRFEAVEFSYPGSARPALSQFHLDIPTDTVVAIVGPNGAGKSTVFKLLCRFYEPKSGRVLIDGQDIAEQTPAEIRRSLSVLFQDPVRYSATVSESVALADPADVSSSVRVRAAVHAAGADGIVQRLPERYATLLGKEFESGTELSGGEWQRIALARALMRPAPILLLDEPTSAMDSWAELEWFDRLREATVGRTTIIITHRFTTAMRADVIHVMDDGRIVESGSHDELVAAGGAYSVSWTRQTGESQPVLTG